MPDDQETLSVDVVLLTLDWNRCRPVDSDVEVDLNGNSEPSNEVVSALLNSALTLVAEGDIPPDLVGELVETAVPPLFRSSPSLLDHRALLFSDGRCAVGGHLLQYHQASGLELGEPPAEPPMVEQSFDLLTQPWIPVLCNDGNTDMVSLTDLFTRSRTIRRITGETAPMTAALYRLVLALLHRIYGPGSETEWKDLWETESFPRGPMAEYRDRFADRFDLFHETRPFLQCPQLAALRPATPAKLVPYRAVGNNVTLFDHTTADDEVVLRADEAARWLVTTHAFDPGGMKTPFLKDKSSERAHCNNFGVILVEGANLHETLLLNTLVYHPVNERPVMTTADDCPVWEREEPPLGLPGKARPRGWTDLLTWPSRRILLSSENGMVTGVVLTPGDRLMIDVVAEEKMAAFRRPRDPKGKIKKDAPLLPVRLHPVRGVWRHSVDLLMKDLWLEGDHHRAPALDQLDHFTGREHIPADAEYTLRVFGQRLDKKAAVIEAWQEEEVPAPVPLLRSRDERVGGLIGEAISLADEIGSALRALQANFRRELKAEPYADIDLSYWPRLARPFGTLLSSIGRCLDEGKTAWDPAWTWAEAVIRLGEETASRWVRSSPLEATSLLVLGKHHAQFLSRLATTKKTYRLKIVGYCAPEDDDD